jgi:hypothetical protein
MTWRRVRQVRRVRRVDPQFVTPYSPFTGHNNNLCMCSSIDSISCGLLTWQYRAAPLSLFVSPRKPSGTLLSEQYEFHRSAHPMPSQPDKAERYPRKVQLKRLTASHRLKNYPETERKNSNTPAALSSERAHPWDLASAPSILTADWIQSLGKP